MLSEEGFSSPSRGGKRRINSWDKNGAVVFPFLPFFFSFIINNHKAVAGASIGPLLVVYNSKSLYNPKNLNFLGALPLFKICSNIFMIFEVSDDFGHAETGTGAKTRVDSQRETFALTLKWSENLQHNILHVF